jgi:hypothetical protein
MAADPEFAAWMQDVKQALASIRATANEKESSKRDKRLDHVLPMQFEHQGKLHWGYLASRTAMWSAFTELGVYLCVALAVVFGIVRDWIPPWLWIALAVAFAITWIASRVYRRLERPAQQWREQMEVVPGVLVYANTVLYEPGPQLASNAGILFTFDETLGADPERMQELAKRCAELHDKATRARPGEEELQRRAVGWSEDRPESNPHVFDRVQVPKSVCGNDQTFFTLVCITRTELPDGVIDRRFYPLLARRGRNESVTLVPASVWAGGTAT